jgi:hypothetical protein
VGDVTNSREAEDTLRRQARELTLLHRVRRAVARELEVRGVLSRAVEAVAETYGYTRLSAYLLEGGNWCSSIRSGTARSSGGFL